MIKRLNMFYVVVFMFFTMTTVSFASDLPSSWAQEEVDKAIKLGYVPIELQSDYQQPITREEFATLFVTAIFSDINDTNSRKPEYMKEAWYFRNLNVENFLSKVKSSQVFEDTKNKYVKVANMLGIINGNSESTFNPNGKITREQVAIMIANYAQTSTAPSYTYIEGLEDFNDLSSWAKQGVAFTYESALMKGTKAALRDEEGNYTQKSKFSGEAMLTREQAVVIISRLGRNQRDLLDHIIIRGFVYTNMDTLMSGIEIDGDIVKLKGNGYNNKYTDLANYLNELDGIYSTYTEKASSEKINSLFFSPPGPDAHMLEPEHIDRVLNNEYSYYNYESYTVEYNKDNYLTIVKKLKKNGYFSYGAYLMFGDTTSENGPTKVVLVDYK